MATLLYLLARLLLLVIRRLPLTWAARLGRVGGAATFWLDGKHRRVALEGLTQCFGT